MEYHKIKSNIIKKYKDLYGEHSYGTPNPHSLYLEHHHIVHIHEGGKDNKENMVWLPFRAHRFIHKLDSKIDNTLSKRYTASMMYGHSEESRSLMVKLGGSIQGKKNRESGHLKKISSLGGQVNVKSGHIYTIATKESSLRGGKASVATHGPQLANGGKAAVKSGRIYTMATPESRSKGGTTGSKRANSKVISSLDGRITSVASAGYWNKKDPKYIGTWKDYGENNGRS